MNKVIIGKSICFLAFQIGVALFLFSIDSMAHEYCIDVLPPHFCGCTWGTVLYEGMPVESAAINLSYNGVTTETTTTALPRPYPYPYVFSLSAAYDLPNDVGAKRGDLLTWSATYQNETITRTVRALPGSEAHSVYADMAIFNDRLQAALQQVTFALPHLGVWEAREAANGYAETAAMSDETLWMGGTAGLIERNLNDGTTITHQLGVEINDIAIDSTGNVWALAHLPNQLHRYDGNEWIEESLPIIAFTIAADNTTNRIVVGGYDGIVGAIAEYNSDWSAPVLFETTNFIYAVGIGSDGAIWVGTGNNGEGVYRLTVDGREQFTTINGLPTDAITQIAIDSNAVYMGGLPNSNAVGTVGRYDLTTQTWEAWELENGLPESDLLADQTAEIIDLAVYDDVVLVSTDEGIHQLVAPDWWNTRTASEFPISTLATNGTTHFAIGEMLYQYAPDQFVGERPIATIHTIQLNGNNTFSLSGSGTDDEPDDNHIIAWEWMSDDMLLCNGAECVVRPSEIETDICTDRNSAPITFRVQDDEGQWSDRVTREIACSSVPLSISLTLNTVQTKLSPNVTMLIMFITIGFVTMCEFRHKWYLMR